MSGAAHSSVKRYRALARGHARPGLDRELLLDGVHLLTEALESGLSVESAVFDHETVEDARVRALAESLLDAGTEVLHVSRKTLESMSPVRTPSGAVGIARRTLITPDEAFTRIGKQPALVVVACDVQDPGNLGGMMRTAEAAGATAFVATASSADPFGWKALRGSMGSALRLPTARADLASVLAAMVHAGIEAVALAPRGGTPLADVSFREPVALLVGGEGGGLSGEVVSYATRRVSIPMCRPVESLNVGVATALVLYEAFRQREGHHP